MTRQYRDSRSFLSSFLVLLILMVGTCFSMIQTDHLVESRQIPGFEVRERVINAVSSCQAMFGNLCVSGNNPKPACLPEDPEPLNYAMMDGLHSFLFVVGE